MRIKDVIKESGLTYQELAEKMEISVSAVKKMVGADSLTTATLEKMAGALGVPMWQLIVSPADVLSHQPSVTLSCPHCGKPLKIMGV